MYMEMATEEDKKMAEGWKAGADGILIFTGLFSAAVATLISVSIQDIRQDPQDTSNFYLSNIYRSMADPNTSVKIPVLSRHFHGCFDFDLGLLLFGVTFPTLRHTLSCFAPSYLLCYFFPSLIKRVLICFFWQK
ncbi:hypothetical protein EI94DRAFT_1728564 [Lactarius quietus]|nr:hypothetical protein EI94DRAFT_1728564 [Lactarius quietus]